MAYPCTEQSSADQATKPGLGWKFRISQYKVAAVAASRAASGDFHNQSLRTKCHLLCSNVWYFRNKLLASTSFVIDELTTKIAPSTLTAHQYYQYYK